MTVFAWSDGEKRLSLKFDLVCLLELEKKFCAAATLFWWTRINVLVILKMKIY